MGLLNARVALLAILAILPAGGAGDAVSEPVAKAAVLYNLATYTTWPDDRGSRPELVIGVAGPDPVLAALAQINGKRVQRRTILVREVRPEDDPSACDILYIPGTYGRTYALLRAVADGPVLIVGDGELARRDGAAVRIFFERSRLRLEIELTAVERAHVRISSKVLSLARVLRNGHVVTTLPRS